MAIQQGATGLRELALFAGAGGGILGGRLLGWRTVCAVEWDAYAASVLVARQNDGTLAPFPIWDDVQTFDGRPWRGRVDVISGGFPCQDISAAGRGAGIDGERSGMWAHMARIVREVRPRFVFVENSPILTSRGLCRVLGDLAAMGYDAEWGVLGAHHAGAPHKRDRIWIVAVLADASRRHAGQPEPESRPMPENASMGAPGRGEFQPIVDGCGADVADAMRERRTGLREHVGCAGPAGQGRENPAPHGIDWWSRDPADGASGTEPAVGRVAHGVAARVDRLRCLGNGQVPAVAALAWRTLLGRLNSPQMAQGGE